MANADIERVIHIYDERGYDHDTKYTDFYPAYLHRIQGLERHYLRALSNVGRQATIGSLQVLDFGCGTGRWFGRWLAWGANPDNLHGIDVRKGAVSQAQLSFPTVDIEHYAGEEIPHPDGSMDVVCQNLVFSSMLDDHRRQQSATEIKRVLKPGGLMMWYDFSTPNPGNPNTRRVSRREVTNLLAPLATVYCAKLTLAPPLASRVTGRWPTVASVMETLPLLRTHYFMVFQDQRPLDEVRPNKPL